jgi:site-specific recombinase XerD
MFETLYRRKADIARHRTAPLAAERERYLQHCAEQGGPWGRLRTNAKWTLWAAVRMSPDDRRGVDDARLHELVRGARLAPSSAETYEQSIRPWLKFLGWWRDEREPVPFGQQLERFISWMRDERGLSAVTIDVRRRLVVTFLRWCVGTQRDLASLRPEDLDAYFVTYGAPRWSRISVATMAARLRAFLCHAASTGACRAGLAESIVSPPSYELASLPYALIWDDVRRVLASAGSDTPRDVRDRAILMLLAIYGLRRGEVAALRLDQIDWTGRRLEVERPKRRQPQVYPLQASVADALARYINTVRPAVAYPQVFIRLQAPRRPIGPGAIYHIVNQRLRVLGIKAAHLGPHALRHACATKLLADGLTLKEIGDHLGHRSSSATMIYAKVNLAALREVGAFDLGGLQ